MINRTLIRLKIVQLLYAFYQAGGKNIDQAEKELLFSLSKAYDLYNYLLLLIVDVTHYAADEIERREQTNRIAHIDEPIDHRFADNKFALQLSVNKQLREFCENQKKTWRDHQDYLRHLLADIQQSDIYRDYMAASETGYEADRELWRQLYRSIIQEDERLDDLLENESLYWNDDKDTVDSFVLKTIKRFEQSKGAKQELLPEYKDNEDREYAVSLYRHAVLNDETYRQLIAQTVHNWEMDRMAFMDIIIMQVALAEILTFPQIPSTVTINEFVEIAKYYSTPRSAGYVNGVLDAVVHNLKADGRLPGD